MFKITVVRLLSQSIMGPTAKRLYVLKSHLLLGQPTGKTGKLRYYNMNGGGGVTSPPPLTNPENISHFLEMTFASSDIGVLSSEATCKKFVDFYSGLPQGEKVSFLKILSQQYGVNQDNVVQVSRNVIMAQERGEAIMLKAEERLRSMLIPQYQVLFQKIGRIEGGVKFLVDMRGDILTNLTHCICEKEIAHLRALQLSIRELLSLWFFVGFLKLERITWKSPCDMVQKVSEYEAVHPIRNWTDLKRRVGPYRRCFVFTHGSMPREPVVVLHTALTSEISNSIHSIIHTPALGVKQDSQSPKEDNSVDPLSEKEDENRINAAVFYSITSTQKGLQSVDLGNYLIKSAVQEVQSEFSRIHQFSSLSPIPGFKDWLMTEVNKAVHAEDLGESQEIPLLLESEIEQLRQIVEPENSNMIAIFKGLLQTHSWVTNENICQVLKVPLMRLCCRYLYREKRRGYALNPVANFHLSNGAMLWRVNWMGDMSMRGINQSCGLMVNYRYYLEDTEENSRRYLEFKEIPTTPDIQNMAAMQDVKPY